jgi:hypothetical protein
VILCLLEEVFFMTLMLIFGISLVLATYVVTTGAYTVLFAFAFRRVALHLQKTPAAVVAVSEHVLVPLFGKKRDESENKKSQPGVATSADNGQKRRRGLPEATADENQ